jgi:O-glycosyl hydrolase
MGHYSRFIRPGMHRLAIKRNDNLTPVQIAQNVMVTAYSNEKQVVLVAINYTGMEQTVKPELANFKAKNTIETYLTTADKDVNMLHKQIRNEKGGIKMPARSMMTIVLERN